MLNPYVITEIARERQKEILERARVARLAHEAKQPAQERGGSKTDLKQNWASTFRYWIIAFGQWLTTRQKPIL